MQCRCTVFLPARHAKIMFKQLKMPYTVHLQLAVCLTDYRTDVQDVASVAWAMSQDIFLADTPLNGTATLLSNIKKAVGYLLVESPGHGAAACQGEGNTGTIPSDLLQNVQRVLDR